MTQSPICEKFYSPFGASASWRSPSFAGVSVLDVSIANSGLAFDVSVGFEIVVGVKP